MGGGDRVASETEERKAAEERGRIQAMLENLTELVQGIKVTLTSLCDDQKGLAAKMAQIESDMALRITQVENDMSLKIAATEASLRLQVIQAQSDWAAKSAASQAVAVKIHNDQDKRIADLESARRILQWLLAIATALITSGLIAAGFGIWGLITHQYYITKVP
jgi:hypothetical protein